jgi:hypothetical protein
MSKHTDHFNTSGPSNKQRLAAAAPTFVTGVLGARAIAKQIRRASNITIVGYVLNVTLQVPCAATGAGMAGTSSKH